MLTVPLLLLAASCAEPRPSTNSTESSTVRVYTNEDLDRVAPFRAQTGALSVPAVQVEPPTSRRRSDDSAQLAREEAYWRREADRVREKVRTIEDQADDLRSRIAAIERERRSFASSKRSSGSNSSEALERRLERLMARKRALEENLADRARRADALPGWLR